MTGRSMKSRVETIQVGASTLDHVIEYSHNRRLEPGGFRRPRLRRIYHEVLRPPLSTALFSTSLGHWNRTSAEPTHTVHPPNALYTTAIALSNHSNLPNSTSLRLNATCLGHCLFHVSLTTKIKCLFPLSCLLHYNNSKEMYNSFRW